MSNFGKAQLLKYGWTEDMETRDWDEFSLQTQVILHKLEKISVFDIILVAGKGLGKDENGIAEALKPKLKFDTSGIGHKDSDFQWWSSVYDKALKNVVSDNNSEKVSINVKKENAFNISSTQSGLEVSDKKLPLHYGKFLKTSTLKDGSLIKDKTCTVIEEDKKEELSFTQISDEELFKACGGRTAHKGARHGLKLSGKLARIAEQEKKLLSGEFLKSYEISSDDSKKSKKAKKRKKSMDVEDCTSQTTVENISDNEDSVIPSIPSEIPSDRKLSKRSVKKLKRKVSDLSHQLSKSSLLESDDPCTSSSKVKEQFSDKTSQNRAKKLRRKVNELSNRLSNSCLLEETATDDHGSNVDECENPSQKVSKKSKKKKHKRKFIDEHNVSSGFDGIQLDHDIVEPCTKKSRKQPNESTVFANFENANGISVETETNEESSNSKYSYATWRNAKIKSKKLKKHDKKSKNKLESN